MARKPSAVPAAWPDFPDEVDILDDVGPGAFARGSAYANEGRVTWINVDPRTRTLYASVEGSRERPYMTLVTVGRREDTGSSGHCTCPIGVNCKHVAAVLLAARRDGILGPTKPSLPEWERVLSDVVSSEPAPAEALPIGLQVELVDAPGGGVRLRIRPVVPGNKGRWVRTGIGWRDLRYSRFGDRRNAAHREALDDLYAAHRGSGLYTYGDPAVFLDEFGPALWPLLERVVAAGVPIVPVRQTDGPVVVARAPADITVDVSADADGDLTVAPVLHLPEGHGRAEVLSVIGTPPHGVAVRLTGEGAGAGEIMLAPLVARLTPRAGAVVEAGRITVPAADSDRFLRDYFPALRRVLKVHSADGSVALPEISPPRLALHLAYGAGHRVDLTWSFRYEIDGEPHYAPFDVTPAHQLGQPTGRPLAVVRPPAAPAAGATGANLRAAPAPALEAKPPIPASLQAARDRTAEQRLLSRLRIPADLPGLRDPGPPPTLAPHAVLHGVDAAVLTQEVVPALREQGVVVETTGDVPDYRFSDAAPVIRVSARDTGDPDWFDLGVHVEIDGEDIPFEPLFVALARGESHLVLDSGTWFSLDRPELEQLRKLIEEARSLEDRQPGELRLSSYQTGLWEELVNLGVVAEQSERWAASVRQLLDGEQADPPPPPAGLAATLRPYQLEGYRWLTFLWEAGLGGILADDMGLGKTVQTLAAVLRAHETGRLDAPVLVVAPTSVVGNWAAEAEKFAPGLTVRSVDETRSRSRRDLADDVAGAHVVVTSYAIFRIDHDAFSELPWSGLVLDEAQFVKNHQAQTYRCARRLRAPFKLAITGTPLENSLMDLWSLLSIVAPGMFPDPARFTETYRKPVEKEGDAEALAALRRRIAPFIRRRTKEQVATELPAKQEQVLHVQLNPKHRKVYQTHLQRERRKILSLVDDLDKNRFTILRSLTLLRQLSLDPALVDEKYAGVPASKTEVFLEQLQEVIDGGHRALVFSQFTGFLGSIRDRLDAAGIDYCYLDGRTRHRARRIEEFKTGTAPVFLISLKAGGFGLNLTEADYCFILDPWWNPAAEAQAVDRTHRIGQDKHVMVYRLVAQETIEEKVVALQARKRDLFDKVVDEGGALAAPLSPEDIRELLEP